MEKPWSISKIKYRLHYLEGFEGYDMGREKDPETLAQVRKRPRHRDGYFVSDCLENAWFKECFAQLDNFERWLLKALYVKARKRSDDWSTNTETKIWLKYGARSEVAKIAGREYEEIKSIEKEALGKMVDYLNPKKEE